MKYADVAERLRWPLTVLLAVAAVSGSFLLLQEQETPPLQIVSPTPQPRALRVYVSGAVQRPGVYEFREGDRVDEAVRMAGGPSAEADLDRLNLSLRLRDEMHVLVPFQPAFATPSSGAVGGQQYDLINLNTATAEQLDTLPGVGPVTVGKIIEHRERTGPFQRIEELLELRIVNSSTFDRIKGRITAP